MVATFIYPTTSEERMLFIFSCIVISTWLVAELRTIKFRHFKTSDDFCLTHDELADLGDLQHEEQIVSGKLARASNKVASLEKLGRGLRRNKNGDFDGRNKLGKKLNRELPRTQALAFQYQIQFNEIQERIGQFNELPKCRAVAWVKAESRRLANRTILILFAVGLIVVAVSGYQIANYWILVILLWATLLYLMRKYQKTALNAKLGI
jgi:hypothetical protein